MKGILKDKQRQDLIVPLKVIGTLVGEHGLYIDIFEDDEGNVRYVVPAKNQHAGVMIIHEWKSLFKNFEINKDLKIGILEPNDFIGKLGIFTEGDLNIHLDEDSKLHISQDSSSLLYRTTDPDLIKGGKRSFKGSDWLATFDYNEDLKRLSKAMGVMGKEECVLMKADKDSQKITLTVRGKNMENNTFKVSTKAEVKEDIESLFKKDILQIIFNSKLGDMKVRLASKMVNIECIQDEATTNFYVAKVAKF